MRGVALVIHMAAELAKATRSHVLRVMTAKPELTRN